VGSEVLLWLARLVASHYPDHQWYSSHGNLVRAASVRVSGFWGISEHVSYQFEHHNTRFFSSSASAESTASSSLDPMTFSTWISSTRLGMALDPNLSIVPPGLLSRHQVLHNKQGLEIPHEDLDELHSLIGILECLDDWHRGVVWPSSCICVCHEPGFANSRLSSERFGLGFGFASCVPLNLVS
jgi:hypothetical protein